MIALTLLLALAGLPQAAPEPGVFTHGPWQGRCYRDGYLAGMDHELCRGTMAGPLAVAFERSAASFNFQITAEGCPPLTLNIAPPPATLTPEKRAGALSVMLRLTTEDMLKRCKSKLKAPKFDVAALGAMLVETHGLEAAQ